MSRSLLRQLDQIRNTDTYDDVVTDFNTSGVAEPVVSGTLEGDMNIIRSLMKQVKGGTNWFDDPGKYFDPTNTDGSSTANKQLSLANIKDNTLDAKTIILAVTHNNSEAGHTVTSGTEGILITPFDTRYSDPANRIGLPIYHSVTNSGTYYDEGGADNVCRVDVLTFPDAEELYTTGGHLVYGKLHDAADHGGTGEGTDVYVKFYANDVEIDLSSLENFHSSIYIIHPFRRQLSDMQEYEWQRTRFTSAWAGDIVLIDDISNLWSYTGAGNDITDPGPWTNETASYVLASSPSTLRSAIDVINTEIGSRAYTEDNYVTDGEALTSAIDDLDMALKDVADSVTASSADKYIESVVSGITKNTSHATPAAYTPVATSGREGMNMDVYVDGQLLAADTGADGVNADRDYAETDGTHVTFRFTIVAGRNITYVIRQ